MNISNSIKHYCEKNNIMQKEVAQKLQVSKTSISCWFNGYDIIPICRLVDFVNIYKISLDYLLGLKKENNYIPITIDKKTIGSNLKKLRKSRNLTLKYLSERINMSIGAYCDYENGKNLIKTTYLISLIDVYKSFSIDDLFKENS